MLIALALVPNAFAPNNDQRFQLGFRDGCLTNFTSGSHSAAYQIGFDKGQHNACSEFRGSSPSQSTSSINPIARGQANSGRGSLVTKPCNFANSHLTLVSTIAHLLGFGSIGQPYKHIV